MSRVAHRWSQGLVDHRLAGLGGPPPDGRFIGAPTAATPQCIPQGSSDTCSPTLGSAPSCAPTASTAPSLSTTSSATFVSMKANFRGEGGIQSESEQAFSFVSVMLLCTSLCNTLLVLVLLFVLFFPLCYLYCYCYLVHQTKTVNLLASSIISCSKNIQILSQKIVIIFWSWMKWQGLHQPCCQTSENQAMIKEEFVMMLSWLSLIILSVIFCWCSRTRCGMCCWYSPE